MPAQSNRNNRRFNNQQWNQSASRQSNFNNQQWYQSASWLSNSNNQQNMRSNSRKLVWCILCEKFGHTEDVCRSRLHNHFEAKANFASNLQSTDNSWVLDSGATHHVTAEPHNLEEYTGNEGISMGNGKTIPITHTGLSQIQAPN